MNITLWGLKNDVITSLYEGLVPIQYYSIIQSNDNFCHMNASPSRIVLFLKVLSPVYIHICVYVFKLDLGSILFMIFQPWCKFNENFQKNDCYKTVCMI